MRVVGKIVAINTRKGFPNTMRLLFVCTVQIPLLERAVRYALLPLPMAVRMVEKNIHPAMNAFRQKLVPENVVRMPIANAK
jgi:hypothetical protein